MARIVMSKTEPGSEEEATILTEGKGDETKIRKLIEEATLEQIPDRY
jgi:5S rRNA maturation endonuclease (ribonuclease M5)